MSVWADAIAYGTHADRPAPGLPGRLYGESDTGQTFRDNGIGWDLFAIASAGVTPFSLVPVPVTTDTALGGAQVLCRIDVADVTITLPDPLANVGQLVAIVTDGNAFSVKQNDGTTDAPNSGVSPALYVSDGSTWWSLFGLWV